MSHDVVVYAKGRKPVAWAALLRELRARGVPSAWEPSFTGKPRPDQHLGGFLRPEGGGGPAETITVGWDPITDDDREELLAMSGASPHVAAIRAAQRVFEIAVPSSAGPLTLDRLRHLVEVLGGPTGGVVYDSADQRLYGTKEYRDRAGRG